MNLALIQRGEGRDLVLLHGYLSPKEYYLPLIDYFSRSYRVTAFDFPGMGQAEPLPAAWSVSDYADWTASALASLGVEFPLLMAHSFGGRVALKLLSRGDVFDRAVLFGCAGVRPRHGPVYRLKVLTYRTVRSLAPRYAETHFGSREYRTLSPLMRESYKRIVNEDLLDDAARIRRPVLFLNGEKDRATPPSTAKKLAARIPHAKYAVLKGCGHFAFLDDPLAFKLAAEEFYHA